MAYSSYDMGGLNMLNVKNVVHALHVKWMNRFVLDCGLTWSQFIWLQIDKRIPNLLFCGLQHVPESSVIGIDNFYAVMVRSFAHVNDLFCTKNKDLPDFPINLCSHPKSTKMNILMSELGYNILADLPLDGKKIDHAAVQEKWNNWNKLNKSSLNCFMICYSLQTKFNKFIGINSGNGCHLLHPELLNQMKTLLCSATSQVLSLTKWDLFFGIMP